MTTVRQLSFAAGEIAPSLYARVDQVRYATGLKTLRNFWVMRSGGVTNRPGTSLVCEVKDSSKAVRLVPFVYNSDQTYVLEFGNLYMRVLHDGAQVSDTSKAIEGATQASPISISYSAHGLVNGDEVYIEGVVGMTELNNRNFVVADATEHAFSLKYLDGTYVDSSGFGAYVSGGTAYRIYTLATPYLEADLPELQFAQCGDVVTIAHREYAPRELTRTGHAAWTLSEVSFAPTMARPTAVWATAGVGGSTPHRYRVTAVSSTGEESLPGLRNAATVIESPGPTKANPCSLKVTGHGLLTGEEVYISGVGGMVELNGRYYTITVVDANNFTLDGVDSRGYTTWTSGGTITPTLHVLTAGTPNTNAPHVVSWAAVPGAREYNIYRAQDGIYGWLGVASGTSFNDVGLSPDTTDCPPYDAKVFDESGEYPGVVSFCQQRQVYASTEDDTEDIWLSKTGNFHNFTTSSPIQDDDSIQFNFAGRQVNEVRHILELGEVIVMTSGGEWVLQGDTAGIVRPTSINPKQHTYHGAAANLSPIVAGGNAIFVQARGSIVRDLAYDLQVDGYRGNDLTVFSSHLIDGYTIEDWAYQETPHSIIWMVRDDGTLLSLTYIREHQLAGWARHDFENGLVENVCVVPEGTEDALYVVVKREIDGGTVRYVERMNTRSFSDINTEAVFVDCAQTYDGRHTGSTTMTLSGGTSWTNTETLTLTASAGVFSSSDIGYEIRLTGSDESEVAFTIEGCTSNQIVTGKADITVPPAMRNVAITTWGKAVDVVGGLWALEGEDVSVFADGGVVASPNNSSMDTVTVTNGTVSLDGCYEVIHVGLPITADLETLNIDSMNGETIIDKGKLVTKVTVVVEATRGLWSGTHLPDNNATSDSQYKLYESKVRDDESYNDAITPYTGTKSTVIGAEWDQNGRTVIRQIDPVPLTVLAICPAGLIFPTNMRG